ncbi:unnamed protein product, partial [Oppiella nova]
MSEKLTNETPDVDSELTRTSVDTGAGLYSLSDEQKQLDIQWMCENGFIIEWDDSLSLGFGSTADAVYRGTYGQQITKLADRYHQHIRNVDPGDLFAAKYCQPRGRMYKMKAFEYEKDLMKCVSHRNVLGLRMAINLGQKQTIERFTGVGTETTKFDTYSRMFLIMDYADHGSLCEFLLKKDPPQTDMCNGPVLHSLLADLCYGLQYLHSVNIFHGDIDISLSTVLTTLHTKYSDNASDVCDTDCNHWKFDESYGTTIIQEFQLVCDKSWLPSLSQSIYQSGYAVNGLILGYLSDRFGRRPVLWLAIILEICGGLSVIFSGSMTQYIISRFFLGLGDSGRGTQNTANVQKHRTILDLLSHRLMRNYTLIFWFSFAVNAFIYHGISLNVQQIG